MKKKTKQLKCKNCKQRFNPYENTTLNPYCKEIECQTKKALFLLEKKRKQDTKSWNIEKRERKEKLKTNADYVKELQYYFNKFIRLRDKEKGCISCSKPLLEKYDAGHFYSTGAYPQLRFEEFNTAAQCVFCNRHQRGAIHNYRIGIRKRYGQKILDFLEKERNKPKKYSIAELKEMIIHYKQKIKNYE